MRIWQICLFLCFQIVYQIGCSLIGLGLGSIVDSVLVDTTMVSGYEARNIEAEKPTRVLLKNGARVVGNIRSIEHLPDSIYEREYAGWHSDKRSALPSIGDSIAIRTVPGMYAVRTSSGTFAGFDLDRIDLKYGIRVQTIQDRYPKSLHLTNVEHVTGEHGMRWAGSDLIELLNLDRPPVNTAVRLRLSAGDTVIATYDIDSILVAQGPERYKWIGFAAGAAVDIYLLAAVIVNKPKTSSSGFSSTKTTGC